MRHTHKADRTPPAVLLVTVFLWLMLGFCVVTAVYAAIAGSWLAAAGSVFMGGWIYLRALR